MMYFSEKPTAVYATVWNITTKDKYTDLRISTSERKNDDSKAYINSNWFVRCIGHAHNKAKELTERDKIIIQKVKFTNELVEDKSGQKRNQLRILVFDFDIVGEDQKQPSNQQKKKAAPKKQPPKTEAEENDEDEEELPF